MSAASKRHSDHANNVIAALKLLGAQPEGAKNDPVLRAAEVLGAAKPGRTLAGYPPPANDRPSLADFRRLERENVLLTDHAEMLACALGACPNCWGTIPDCEECDGIGRPGAFTPDPHCFSHFVKPVLDLFLHDRPARNVLADDLLKAGYPPSDRGSF